MRSRGVTKREEVADRRPERDELLATVWTQSARLCPGQQMPVSSDKWSKLNACLATYITSVARQQNSPININVRSSSFVLSQQQMLEFPVTAVGRPSSGV